MGITYKPMADVLIPETKAPSNCRGTQLTDFCRLVREGDQSDARGLEGRVKNVQVLVFLYDGATLVGTAAIKHPALRYKRSVFKKAAVPEIEEAYSEELGWIVVTESYRGRKLSRRLVEAAIRSRVGVPFFATSRSDRPAMHRTLSRFGFRRVGRPYPSVKPGVEVFLFVRR